MLYGNTALTVRKIYLVERSSRAANKHFSADEGVPFSSLLHRLHKIGRIIIDSAVIYTFCILAITIALFASSKVYWTFQSIVSDFLQSQSRLLRMTRHLLLLAT